MAFVGNVLWFVIGFGWLTRTLWMLVGVLLYSTVVGIPMGIALPDSDERERGGWDRPGNTREEERGGGRPSGRPANLRRVAIKGRWGILFAFRWRNRD